MLNQSNNQTRGNINKKTSLNEKITYKFHIFVSV